MESSTVSGKMKICGVIGDPIEHTMSPVMHNAAFKKLGLDYIYIPFRVRAEELDQAVEGIRVLNIRGLNNHFFKGCRIICIKFKNTIR